MENRNRFMAVVDEVRTLVQDSDHPLNDTEISYEEERLFNGDTIHGVGFYFPEADDGIVICIEQTLHIAGEHATDEVVAFLITQAAQEIRNKIAPCKRRRVKPDIEDIKNALFVTLFDNELHSELLKELPHKDLGCGLSMVLNFNLTDEDVDDMFPYLTNEMVKDLGCEFEDFLSAAIDNCMDKNEARLYPISDILVMGLDPSCPNEYYNPLSSECEFNEFESFHVLTTELGFGGAAALFYPGVAKRIRRMMGEDFYAIPASRHEMLIIPESHGDTPEELELMVRTANRNIVDETEVLSDRVLFYSAGSFVNKSFLN